MGVRRGEGGEEWAWGEGITILAVLEARESLETRAVERCEGLANSTDGGLVECRSHHEGLIDGFKCNDRTNKFDGQEIDCMCVLLFLVVNKQSKYINPRPQHKKNECNDEVRRRRTRVVGIGGIGTYYCGPSRSTPVPQCSASYQGRKGIEGVCLWRACPRRSCLSTLKAASWCLAVSGWRN